MTYPTYRGISSPSESLYSLEIATPAATAAVILTTEDNGSSKLILQHRDQRNNFYGDVPGASVAGLFDGKLDGTRQNRGKLVPIDTETVKNNIRREALEEIGLRQEDLIDVRITGLATDLIRIHNEFLLFAKAAISSRELEANATDHAKSVKPNEPYDFDEKIYIIDGTPEAIEILLTKVKCPIPSTHTAAFVAAGYSMVLKRDGQEEAEIWKERLHKGIQENYAQIDRMVQMYYEQNPQTLNDIPQGKPSRNPHGYEPAYMPQQQGLPDIDSELKRVSLISE